MPQVCMTNQWVLCLNKENDHSELAEHIALLYKLGKQDSMIFLDNSGGLLRHLALLEPSLFRSNSPIFMPLELANSVELKLDTNILFFVKEDVHFKLVDMFAVNGGEAITLDMGSWNENDGLKLGQSISRWDRRTDLMGAVFRNNLWEGQHWAKFIYNKNGTVIGSKGWFQDQLFYVTDRLNLTVKIVEVNEYLNNTSECPCIRCKKLLLMDLSDICSGGLTIKIPMVNGEKTPHELSLATMKYDTTLVAGVPTGTAIDAWAYVTVFEFPQWLIYFSILLLLSFGLMFMGALSLKDSHHVGGTSFYEGFFTTLLFVIQQGNHPPNGQIAAKRVLTLTTSMLTLLVFIYYSNDITSKLTAGSPPHPVRTFEDVLDHGYQVITVGAHHYTNLKDSKHGTAKHSVYKLYFEKYEEEIQKWRDQQENKGPSQTTEAINDAIKWYVVKNENLEWAAEQIVSDPKKLFYGRASAVGEKIVDGKVVALKMDDSFITYGGFWLGVDSEYLSVFHHYLLKASETGILNRIKNHWNRDLKPPIKIGFTEPEPLGINNIVFLFSLLGATIIMSVVIAALEKGINKMNLLMSKSKDGGALFTRRGNIRVEQRMMRVGREMRAR